MTNPPASAGHAKELAMRGKAKPTLRPSVIVFGPPGCGKTRYAEQLAAYFGALTVVDPATWPVDRKAWAAFKANTGRLWLITDERVPSIGVFPEAARRVFTFDEAMALAQIERLQPHDPVNHPTHYTRGKVECIDAIEAAMSPAEFRGFLKGQVIKYTWRLGLKGDATEDAAKAAWYQNRLLEVLRGQG